MPVRNLLLLVLCVGLATGLSLPGQAQGPTVKAKLTDQSIVKDTAGTVYPAAIWKNLLATGWYTLRVKDAQDENSEYLLLRLSEEEHKRRLENAPKPRESQYFKTGETLSSFSATDMNGKKYKLKELKGKVVVLNFWFVACMPCQQEIPELNKLADEYKDSTDIVFLAVCLDEEYKVEEFLAKKPFHYNIISDGRYITNQYGIKSYPTHVVLDKEGKIIFHTSGYSLALAPWLRRTIAAALE